jgi:hypothetical protein
MAKAKRKSARRKGNGIGHNGAPGGVPDEVYERWLPKIALAENALRNARSRLGNLYQQAEKDGCNRAAIKSARRKMVRDTGAVIVDAKAEAQVLRILQSPLQLQFNLFGGIVETKPVNPYLAGQQAGRNAEPIDNNPHKPGTEDFDLWRQGWHSGQEGNRQSLREGAADFQA